MKKDKFNLLLLILLIIFFLIIFFFIINDNRKLTIIETIIKEPILYTEKILEKPIYLIKEDIYDYKNKKLVQKKLNDNAKLENNYSLLKIELNEKNKELDELKKLMDLNNNSNLDIINASIINRNMYSWYKELTIDKGFKDGIKDGYPVINKDGLIGKIVKTSKNMSSVKLLTSVNERFRVAVLIQNDDESVFGILSNYKDGYFVITDLSYNKEIKKDSVVITSGLDDIFPRGLMIGKVDYSKKDNFDLEQIIYVKPSSNFNDIKYVSIVKGEK